MLVQICCSVDSAYFLTRLRQIYPNEKIVGFFYDPNIHPYGEFCLRLNDVKRNARKLGIQIIAGEYDIDAWFEITRGLENEPEKGARCLKCFEFRLEKTFKLAKNLGEKCVTTTLLMSPKKSFEQLNLVMSELSKKFEIDFIAPDFRKNGGTGTQFALAKDEKLYHQNYCGCVFGLQNSRGNLMKFDIENQAKFDRQNSAQNFNAGQIYELISPLSREILPASIEERLSLYECAAKCDENKKKYEIYRDKFINYRLLFARVVYEKLASEKDGKICTQQAQLNAKTLSSFWLYNSHFKREKAKFDIATNCDKFISQKEEIKLFSLDKFNQICGFSYKNVSEICSNPPEIKAQIRARNLLLNSDEFAQGFSPIIIIDEIKAGRYFFEAKSDIFLDVREILVTF